jgi:thiol-disulfide isomerase/thioredoxin
MKLLVGIVLLSASALAQSSPQPLTGDWIGSATVHGQSVPLQLHIDATSATPTAALINGPESAPATTLQIDGSHIVLTFADYARTLDATVSFDKLYTLTGSFGTAANRIPITAQHPLPQGAEGPRCVWPEADSGPWEVAVHSAKGESAWTLNISSKPYLKTFIQRIDGDTGSLYAPCPSTQGGAFLFSHFTPAGPALYSIAPQPNGTLLLSNLLRNDQHDLVGRRPAAARAAALPAPTDPSQQTRMKNPAEPLAFSGTDLAGHSVANTDPAFKDKVVLVAVGGSWCPNCHDEAPVLVQLYKKFHARGLEIVDLSFEEEDQLKNPTRLKAFIKANSIPYTVLLAGTPDDLNAKLPQADHLNCWPTSFLLDRTGRVREIHAGFSGPATGQAYTDLIANLNHQVETLLGESSVAQR